MRMPQALKQAYSQGYPESAVCVQVPIGSRNSAIHNVYHTSLRPSSLFEPRHPSLKVVIHLNLCRKAGEPTRAAQECERRMGTRLVMSVRKPGGRRRTRRMLRVSPTTLEVPPGGHAREPRKSTLGGNLTAGDSQWYGWINSCE